MLFGVEITVIAVAVLAALSIGSLAFMFLDGEGSSKSVSIDRVVPTEKGLMTKFFRGQTDKNKENLKKKKDLQEKLRAQQEAIHKKAKETNVLKAPLSVRLTRAGLKWSKEKYYLFSLACAGACAGLGFFMQFPIYVVAALALVGLLGVPQWYVNFKINKRMKDFLKEFPNAIDVIVRGMKAGLPLNDCMGIVSRENAEPVRSEFANVVEQQRVGLTMPEAVQKMYERVPMPETNFFAIVLMIQAQAGGNLGEALSNLSKVVRERKKMKQKIQAMSMEAKAGAAIIGSLPPGVLIMVYLTTPEYIAILFSDTVGNIMLGGCLLWMLMGILVMKKMINFDF